MLRFFFVILVSLPHILYYIAKITYIEFRPERYSEEYRYKICQNATKAVKRNCFIHTETYGTENLPKEGGYVMFANHQGKYDALGIVFSHSKPCTVVIDKKRSHLPIASQFVSLMRGTRLDRENPREQVKGILKVIEEVKQGRRYIIFPEGGYYHNQNNVREFLPGSFKCAIKAKSPIVPVALIDSYKPFELNSLRPVTTQVHFLPPIYYEEYKDMSSRQIAELTREKIINIIEQVVVK